MDGKIRIGLSPQELETLASPEAKVNLKRISFLACLSHLLPRRAK